MTDIDQPSPGAAPPPASPLSSSPQPATPSSAGLYRAVSPYSWWLALLATLVILAASVAIATAASWPIAYLWHRGGDTARVTALTQPGVLMTWMAVVQVTTCLLVVAAAGLYGARRWRLLSLDRAPTAAHVGGALLGMIALLAPYNAVVFALTPESALADLKPFADLVRSDARWVTAFVVCIGAPLSEELLFRGFLLPALAQSRLGFRGAAILSTTIWAAMHTGYSLAGLLEVTLIGFYFSWILWRWGSLWITILAHALYNSALIAILAMVRI